jgi:Protein of unknown function (DUF2855)
MDFLVAKDDLHRCRAVDAPPSELEPGQALLAVDAFGLTSNNITYAMFGQAMSYWSFFPAEEGWGRVPVWGFAEVATSRHDALEVGTRVYGYLPPSAELVVAPAHVDARGFIDACTDRPSPRPTTDTCRARDWGREGLEPRLADAWRPYVKWTTGWLEVIHGQGPQALEHAYLDLLDGRIDPAKAHVFSLSP